MATEAGHFPNRVYLDANGDFHLNGASFFNDDEDDISGSFDSRVEVTATVGGGTTGLIPAGAKHVTITSANAAHQVSLPAAVVGDKMTLFVGDDGCEVISVVAADEVNDVVVGATNELALVADSHYHFEYVAATKWIARGFTKLGADQAALVPDAL
jgi:hypothetical protein